MARDSFQGVNSATSRLLMLVAFGQGDRVGSVPMRRCASSNVTEEVMLFLGAARG